MVIRLTFTDYYDWDGALYSSNFIAFHQGEEIARADSFSELKEALKDKIKFPATIGGKIFETKEELDD